MCSFCWNFTERQILWSLCSVDFHTLTLQLPIQTPHSVAPELQVFVSSLRFSVKRAHPSYQPVLHFTQMTSIVSSNLEHPDFLEGCHKLGLTLNLVTVFYIGSTCCPVGNQDFFSLHNSILTKLSRKRTGKVRGMLILLKFWVKSQKLGVQAPQNVEFE